MTKAQRISHKKGNQLRRATILALGVSGNKEDRCYWVHHIGAIQTGKYTMIPSEKARL
jgi:hypothetical protein